MTSTSAPLRVEEISKIKRRVLWSLLLRGHFPVEGSSKSEQLLYLAYETRRTSAAMVAEIGFNVGMSSHAILSADPKVQLVSFDLGGHRSTRVAKRLLDKKFAGRHTLICGDSRETVPAFAERNPSMQFDLVFIDGGHEYEVAKADLMNMKSLCTKTTVVIMDDLMPEWEFGKGPTRAWSEAIEGGHVRQHETWQAGRFRRWARGRYVFEGTSA